MPRGKEEGKLKKKKGKQNAKARNIGDKGREEEERQLCDEEKAAVETITMTQCAWKEKRFFTTYFASPSPVGEEVCKVVGHICGAVRAIIRLFVPLELTGIAVGCDCGKVRSWDLSAIEPVPVYLCEPEVTEDVLGSSVQVAETFRQVGREKVLEQVLCRRLKVWRVADFAGNDLLVELDRVAVFCEKGWVSREHFEEKDAQRPPVDGLVVTFGRDDLWRKVVWSTAESPCDIGNPLCESEICDFEVSVCAEKDVLWLEISVHEAVLVEVVDCEGDFGCVELGYRVREPLRLSQQSEELAARHKVHDHVEICGVGEGSPEVYEEGVTDEREYGSF